MESAGAPSERLSRPLNGENALKPFRPRSRLRAEIISVVHIRNPNKLPFDILLPLCHHTRTISASETCFARAVSSTSGCAKNQVLVRYYEKIRPVHAVRALDSGTNDPLGRPEGALPCRRRWSLGICVQFR